MSKVFIVFTVILLAFLSACGSAPAAASTAAIATESATEAAPAEVTQSSSTTSKLITDYSDAATVEQQLLTGILQLEGTNNAITVDQANQLLILWQSLNTFGTGSGQPGTGGPQDGGEPGSDDNQSPPATSTEQPTTNIDTEAVLAQIQAIFTDTQIQAIAALQITNASVETYITDNNLSMQARGGNGQGGEQQTQDNPPSGDGSQPQGAPPSDGGNGGQGGPDASGTMQAPADGEMPDMSTQVLLQAVIKLLQEKTGITPQVQ